MSTSTQLEVLAKKYWQDQLSSAEEQVLRQAVARGELTTIDPTLQRYLTGIAAMRQVSLSDDFDQKVLDRIRDDRPKIRRLIPRRWMQAAAGLAIIAIAALGLQDWLIKPQTSNSYATLDAKTRQEYDQMKSALAMVSNHLAHGARESQRIVLFHETQEQIKALHQD